MIIHILELMMSVEMQAIRIVFELLASKKTLVEDYAAARLGLRKI